ncbi:MAG: hypothetical protein DRJ40_09030 [Thermoprotei archaeon]|nr:MAG: hypothetical protein DRJ40_09030 [Thermoprotei archaeon]
MPIKKLVIKVSSTAEQEMLLEEITARVKSTTIRIQSRLNTIEIYIYGTKDMIRAAESEIREIVKYVRGMLTRDFRGLYTYPISHVLSRAGLRVAIPVDLLIQVLEVKGYRAKIEGGSIRTDATVDVVQDLARKISEVYYNLSTSNLAPTAKKLVAYYILAKNYSVEEVDRAVKELSELGLLKEVELPNGEVRVILGKELSSAISTVRELIHGKVSSEGSGKE